MKKLYSLLLLSLSLLTNAQNPGDIVQSFGEIPEPNFFITSIQPDDKLLLIEKTLNNSTSLIKLKRMNEDWTNDLSFNLETGIFGTINRTAIQADGKILVGGTFNYSNGTAPNRLIRLNPNGAIDTSFNIDSSFSSNVNLISVQSNGKILLVSNNGASGNNIYRLHQDGTIDTSFNDGAGFSSYINEICIQADGKILAGGDFSTFNGATQKYLIRLNVDGSKDISFNIGAGFNNYSISSVFLQTDGKILVGGEFTTYQNAVQKYFIRLNSDGTKDMSFNTGNINRSVSDISIQPDGKILLAGSFTSYDGVTENRLIRLNTNGTKDTSFNTGTGFDGNTYKIFLQPNGKIIVDGFYDFYNGVPQNSIIRLYSDGTRDPSLTLGKGFNGRVTEMAVQPDQKILVAGYFNLFNEVYQNGIIRLNVDGTKDTSFNIYSSIGSIEIKVMALQPDGKILIAYANVSNPYLNRIVRLNPDGSIDTSFNSGLPNTEINDFKLQPDGKILILGKLNNIINLPPSKIGRLEADGSIDYSFFSALGVGFDPINPNAIVFAMDLQSDGKILLVGRFSTFNNNLVRNVLRLNSNGSKDFSFNVGNGYINDVTAVKSQPDGKIILAGHFTTWFNNNYTPRLIRINADGSVDASFNAGTGLNDWSHTIAVEANGKILIAGYFTSYNGLPEYKFVRLNSDGSKDTSFNIGGVGFSNSPNRFLSLTNGNIMVSHGNTYNNTNSAALLVILQGDNILSKTDFKASNRISFWPNPVKDFLIINSLENNSSSIKIYDFHGKLLIDSLDKKINVSDLCSGMYIIKTTIDSKEVTGKFIKE